MELIKKLGPREQLQACYEAGPTGYVLYWQLTSLGVKCEVVAPTLVPVKPGDRVKTDRRDARKLAQSHRSGDLTAVWVPDEAHEALRDLVRAREAAKQDQLRARHRLSKFLLRHGRRAPAGAMLWTLKYMEWIRQQVQFEQPAQEYTRLDSLHEVEHANDRVRRLEEAIREAVKLAPRPMQEVMQALQALRGIAQISPLTIVSELGQISRFAGARQLMGYSGAVASEDSSGKRVQPGAITKTGNASSAPGGDRGRLGIPTRPAIGATLHKRQQEVSEEVKEIAWKAQHRLHKRYRSLAAAGKNQQKVVTALGRELLGFIWAIGVKVESNSHHRTQVAA